MEDLYEKLRKYCDSDYYPSICRDTSGAWEWAWGILSGLTLRK